MKKPNFHALSEFFYRHSPRNFRDIFSRLASYFHTYDPANFALIYTLKAGCALLSVLALSFWLISPQQVIFAIFGCVFVFYMHAFTNLSKKNLYLLIFTAVSCLLTLAILPLSQIGLYLAVIVFFWVFGVNILQAISADFHKIAIYLTLLAMAMLISAGLGRFDPHEALGAVALGAGVSSLFRVISFHSYGSFTRRNFGVIFQDLRYMSELLSTPDFEHWHSVILERLNTLRAALSVRAANIKDPSLIRHQELVAFYLQKCEEIAGCLLSLRIFCLRNPNNPQIRAILRELSANFAQLEGIFKDRPALLQNACLQRLIAQNSMPILADLLSVMYYKMQLVAAGANSSERSKIAIKQPDKIDIRSIFRLDNKHFQFALKSASATAIAIALSSFFHLDHGVWIAMGTFTLFKQKINATKINNTDVFIGSLIGFAAGLLLIFFFANSLAIFLLLFVSYLLAIYFRHFPQRVAMVFIMMNTAIFFCAVGLDYEKLILFRLADFACAYAIVLIFSAIWPAKSEDELKPAVIEFCELLDEFFKRNFSPLIAGENQPKNELENAQKFQEIGLKISQITAISDEIGQKNKISRHNLLESLFAINNLTFGLLNYSQTRKINAKDLSDIGIINTRFAMLKNSAQELPSYFYENLHDKLLTNDEHIAFYCKLIFDEQSKIYDFLNSK